jgi:hypothetical protein
MTCPPKGNVASFQCVIEGCPSNGPGPDHGCPAGAFCYVFDGSDGHYCTRVCATDADCGNPQLRCLGRSASDIYGLKICTAD